MTGEKLDSKSGIGFFHLIDWTGKSQKKSFGHGNASMGKSIFLVLHDKAILFGINKPYHLSLQRKEFRGR